MPSQTRPEPRLCPIAGGLEILGDRWTLLILREVLYGSHQFEEIHRFTGAPRDILTKRLSTLVDRGLLEKQPLVDGGRRRGYYLTSVGREVRPVLLAVGEFGERRAGGSVDHWRDLMQTTDA